MLQGPLPNTSRSGYGQTVLTFERTSGARWLDLTATLHQRRHARTERLTDPEALSAWMGEAGLIVRKPSGADLTDTVELREALYELATRTRWARSSSARSAVRVVNERAARPDEVPVLELDRSAGPLAPTTPSAALSTLAREAIVMLAVHPASSLRECADDRCTSLFLDLSQAQRRRWCSMDTCGNRAKVASYRTRSRR